MSTFNENIAELLEVEQVEGNEKLKDFEAWDSLTILSIIAFADENYGVTLTAQELNNTDSVKDLELLINSKTQK